jgi:FtsP/CotA-like multicopper oxidase with cupredoxin domain
LGSNNLGQYIPLAMPEKWVDLNGAMTADDYYEIAAIEFSEKLHSDLPKATRLRGYVQLSTLKNPGKHIALKYPNGSPILDAAGTPVYAYDNPHHLGPIIQSARGTAVRIKFSNYLPAGTAGNLFLPVDTTLTGAGEGLGHLPRIDPVTNLPVLDVNGKPVLDEVLLPYTQNRSEIHLVGGQAPWISAGTPHQWVAPAGEAAAYAAGLGKGASTQNVPDMADPGAGSVTLYFPNDLSARFTYYQDRTSGLTRLNAYAGLAAGYLVTDPVEQALVSGGTVNGVSYTKGTIPADQIPLIIEDKTFVPQNIAQQDAKWNVDAAGLAVVASATVAPWGQAGDLWFPHVYEPNQDPNSIDGTNPVGRWDYGPLFWPIFPALNTLPGGAFGDPSFTPEAYHDTPLVNGTAYPTLTVDAKAYRLRILNASNDRYLNLSLFKADTTVQAPQLDLNGNPILDATGAPLVFTNTEVRMVPAVGDAAGNPAGWGKNLVTNSPVVDASGQPVQFPLPQYPQLATNNNVSSSGPSRAWPTDARPGGAPDPAAAGPDFIVIGNDGGLLPNPVDVPAQPITYELNRRSITVGNIYGYGLLLGPAERSDAIVDFSQYAGQTLIVYNDAPAPTPFTDVRNDYFTGNPDLTASGGTYSTKPGYGPNTRTILQIKVNAAGAAAPYDPTPLLTALPAAYAQSQGRPIVPAVAYNKAFGTNDTDIYAHVATGSIAQPTLDFTTGANGGITLTGVDLISSGGTGIAGGQIVGNAIAGSGTNYDPGKPPMVVFNNTVNGVACLPLDPVTGLPANGAASASATAVVDPGTLQVTAITNFNSGSGYTCAPTVTFLNPVGTSGIGAQAVVKSSNFTSLPVIAKAEQELFDDRGRYNSTGGVEIPLVTAVVQTTVPLGYIDSATEIIKDGEVQVWKLVDNGLWTNSVHFDMADVQLINRVGWDGTVKPPSSNEVGWKDTLRLNPLEDVIIAVRAKNSSVPFGLPQSKRLLDPSKPTLAAGSGLGFTAGPGVLPTLARRNETRVFDNEFAWGSAILGHAENDFTRPVSFQPTVVKPDAPLNLTGLGNGTLTWTDTTPLGGTDPLGVPTLANPKNEIGYKILSVTTDANNNLTYTPVLDAAGQPVTVAANVTRWAPAVPDATSVYSVVAYNVAGDSLPSNTFIEKPPIAPATLTASPVAYDSVTLTWLSAQNAYQLQLWRAVGGSPAVQIAVMPGTATGFVDNAANAAVFKYTPVVSTQVSYTYEVRAINVLQGAPVGNAISAPLTVTTPQIAVAEPTIVSATPNTAGTSVVMRWTDNANNETAYWVDVSAKNSTTGAVINNPQLVMARTAAQGTAINGTLNTTIATLPGNVYTFTVTAVTVTPVKINSTSTPATITVDLSAPAAPAAPVVIAGVQTGTRAPISWAAVAGATSYVVQVQTNNSGTWVSSPQTTNLSANVPIAAGNSYQIQVLAQTTTYGLTTQSVTASNVLAVSTPPAASTAVAAGAAPGAAAGSGQIAVNWVNPSANITGWTIERQPTTGPAALRVWDIITQSITVTGTSYSFTDTVPAPGSYRYRVTAQAGALIAGPTQSNTVTAP